MSSLLAIDPGNTTGLAWCDTAWLAPKLLDDRFGASCTTGEVQGTVQEQVWKIHKGIVRLNVRVMIAESSDHFLLAPGRQGKLTKHSLVPIEMMGALKFLCYAENQHTRPNVLVMQTPSQAKSVVTDAVLTEMGFQVAGRGRQSAHELDAMRHLVLCIRRYGESQRAKHPAGFHTEIDKVLAPADPRKD